MSAVAGLTPKAIEYGFLSGWSNLKHCAESTATLVAKGAAGIRRTIQIPPFVHDQACLRVISISGMAPKTVKNSFLTPWSYHEDNPHSNPPPLVVVPYRIPFLPLTYPAVG